MISETSQLIPALPVRRRETLEIFDTAFKLYRRYFWVLMGWSALIAVMAFIPLFNTLSLFTTPLLYGAVSCCVAAAVRGQKVSFGQCWNFTKPRYGAMLGTLLLSWLIFFIVSIVLYIAGALVMVAGATILSNAPEPVQIVGAVVGVLLVLVVFSVMGVAAFGWLNMVPIVVCLEDDKRSTAALGRALDLLKGNWRRVFGMSLILGLAVIALFGIVGGIYSLFTFARFSEIFSSDASDNAILSLLATFGVFTGLFVLVWSPAQSLVIAVLYLDLRVRREALDLEWTAYASAPPVAPAVAGAVALQTPVETPGIAAQTPASVPAGVQNPLVPTSFAAGGVSPVVTATDAPVVNTLVVNTPVVDTPVVDTPIVNPVEAPLLAPASIDLPSAETVETRVPSIAAPTTPPASPSFSMAEFEPQLFDIRPTESPRETPPAAGGDEAPQRSEA